MGVDVLLVDLNRVAEIGQRLVGLSENAFAMPRSIMARVDFGSIFNAASRSAMGRLGVVSLKHDESAANLGVDQFSDPT